MSLAGLTILHDVAISTHGLLVLMRGPSGCGKTTRAKVIAGSSGVICSADDYFVQEDGTYRFDPTRIGLAHQACQEKCRRALERHQFVVVDNTNIKAWELRPYVSLGISWGYCMAIAEPQGWWCFDVAALQQRTTHGVPLEVLVRQVRDYEHDLTLEKILASKMPEFKKAPSCVGA